MRLMLAKKAIGSTINLYGNEHKTAIEYNETVKDIIDLPDVQRLDNYLQHLNTSRLQHSINVSFYSFRIARFLGGNSRAAARAGLLHDMYYYEFKDADLSCKEHSGLHPEIALENAKKVTDIDSMEENIILSHMWPMTKNAPSHLEGFIVTFADKYCATLEVASSLPKYFAKKIASWSY